MTAVDVAIVGGGMAGLATAYYLRDRGLSVVVLERDTVGTELGSSAGETRMYREMYSDPYLCRQSRAANELWRQLERDQGVDLRLEHGLLFYGEAWDEETIEGSIPGARRVMDDQGIPYEALDADAIARRFSLRPRPDHVGLFEPTAGAIRSDLALQTFRDAATRAGVRVLEGAEVRTIREEAGQVRLPLSPAGEVVASQVVLCAGAWTNRLLSTFTTPLELEIWSMLWGHVALAPEAPSPPQWFCFQQARDDDGGLYYGFPSLDGTRAKVGIDWCPPRLRYRDMRAFEWEPDATLVKHLRTFLDEQLPLAGGFLELRCSPYTMTSDVGFVVDQVPGSSRVHLFTGGSGQAFKFAPLIGASLADLASGREPATDLQPWAATRPAVRATLA